MPIDQRATTDRGGELLLNEPQLRHFEVFLAMLETALTEVDRLGGLQSDAKKNLIVYDSDLPHGFATRAEPATKAIRKEISALAGTLNIAPQHRSRRRTVKAILTAETVRLDDSYSRKLRGYGSVNSRVKAQIDPILDRIRTDLSALLTACESEPTSSAANIRE